MKAYKLIDRYTGRTTKVDTFRETKCYIITKHTNSLGREVETRFYKKEFMVDSLGWFQLVEINPEPVQSDNENTKVETAVCRSVRERYYGAMAACRADRARGYWFKVSDDKLKALTGAGFDQLRAASYNVRS